MIIVFSFHCFLLVVFILANFLGRFLVHSRLSEWYCQNLLNTKKSFTFYSQLGAFFNCYFFFISLHFQSCYHCEIISTEMMDWFSNGDFFCSKFSFFFSFFLWRCDLISYILSSLNFTEKIVSFDGNCFLWVKKSIFPHAIWIIIQILKKINTLLATTYL